MDIDSDGVVSGADIETFIGRQAYLSNSKSVKNSLTQSQDGLRVGSRRTSFRNNLPAQNSSLYPTKPLHGRKLEETLRDLRQKL